jgi:uncharacterized DUF497 family protein
VLRFRWNWWNWEHVQAHGVTPEEAERAVRSASPPYPKRTGGDKWLVWGSGIGGRAVQVIYVIDEGGSYYIIHARPLTTREKKRWRRRKR